MAPVSTGCGAFLRGNDVILPDSGDFSLPETLDCGQAFRWKRLPDGGFFGVARGRACHIAQTAGEIRILGGAEDFEAVWRGYFDLDRDYGEVKRRLSSDPVLARAVAYAPGVRVLRQEPWEALCSFIISQNNNIKRIRGIVETLCNTWGEPLPGGRSSFPGPEVLASLTEEDLQPLRSGFRAKYILDAARKTASGEVDLDHVASLPTEEAAAELCRIRGVGIKVAHCALLYGFHRIECLPVDVWMKRVMSTMYPQGLPEELLPYAGIAQQYLFHYSRSHPELFEA